MAAALWSRVGRGEDADPPAAAVGAAAHAPPTAVAKVQRGDMGRKDMEQELGCQVFYHAFLAEMIQSSGWSLADEAHMIKDQRGACAAAGGVIATLKVGLLGFLEREASLMEATRKAAGIEVPTDMQLMLEFWKGRLTQNDVDRMVAGVAFCAPPSCAGDHDALPQLVLHYFACMSGVGVCGVENRGLAVPRLGYDFELIFPSGNADPDRDEDAVGQDTEERCLQDANETIAGRDSYYGVPLVPRSECTAPGDHAAKVLAPRVADCLNFGGKMLLVHFDVLGYAARWTSKEARKWDEEVRDNMQKLATSYSELSVEMIRVFGDGFGLCVPRSCLGRGRGVLPRVVVDVFLNGADMALEVKERFPVPRLGRDLNVSGWASSLRSTPARRCVMMQEEVEYPWEQMSEDEAWKWFQVAGQRVDEHINGTNLELSWWAGCDRGGLPDDWRRFEKALEETLSRGVPPSKDKALLKLTDELIDVFRHSGIEWAERVETSPRITCDVMCAADRRTVVGWQQARGFCPSMFATALFLRGRNLQSAKLRRMAVKDLMLGRNILGDCAAQDLFTGFKGCLERLRDGSCPGGSCFGVPLVPLADCESGPEDFVRRLLAPRIEDCRTAGGRMILVRFDVLAYLARWGLADGQNAWRLEHETRHCGLQTRGTLRALHEFCRDLAPEAMNVFPHGFGLCIPARCAGSGTLPRSVLELLLLSAGLEASDAASLPLPLWGRELNVSDWSAATSPGSVAGACGSPPLGEVASFAAEWEEDWASVVGQAQEASEHFKAVGRDPIAGGVL